MRRFMMLLLLLLPLAGCGTVGPVKPLLKALPQAVDNVRLQQKGTALLLSWDIPSHNQDGSVIDDLSGFAVYKSDYDLARDCPECRPPKKLLRKIDLAYYRSTNRGSQRIYLWDSAVEEETGYRYKIVPYTKDGNEGAAALVYRPCFTPPPPPVELKVRALDRQVDLHWQAAVEERQGVELLGYNVYRRHGKGYFAAQPVNKKPLAATSYEDLGLDNDSEYSYAVRTVIAIGEQRLESVLSGEVSARPRQR